MGLFTMLGNQVGNLGGALNLPEFGISERINSIGYKATPWNTNNTTNQKIQESRAAGVPVTQQNISKVLGYSTTTPNVLTQQPTPQPRPQQQAPSGMNLKDPNARPGDGWWWDAADGWKPVDNSGGGASNINMMDAINQEFDNLLGGLGGQQGQEEGIVRQNADLQRQGINEQLGFGVNNLNTQRESVRANQANTLADLSKSLRDSSRNVQMALGARGANGSANDAASYALTKLYGNQRAGVLQQTNAQMAEIDTAENNLKASASSMLNDVDTWANSMMSDITARYNSLRQNLGSMKANARIDAIAQIEADIRNVQQQKQQYSMQIQEAARQRLMQLNDYKTQLAGQAQFDPQQQVFNEFSFNPGSYQADQGFDLNPLVLARRKREQNQF